MVKETINTFGEFFKTLRQERGTTLRQFCLEHGFDPGNISKLERGVFPAPTDHSKLEVYARALGLKRGSVQWVNFFDLASVSNRTFGVQDLENEALLRKLPILFRTLDNKELTEEKLDKILEAIKKA